MLTLFIHEPTKQSQWIRPDLDWKCYLCIVGDSLFLWGLVGNAGVLNGQICPLLGVDFRGGVRLTRVLIGQDRMRFAAVMNHSVGWRPKGEKGARSGGRRNYISISH